MIDVSKELAFCDECISHLCENAGPDHIIVKYRVALVRIAELEAQNDSLTSDVEVWRIDRNAWMARYSRARDRSRDLEERLKQYQKVIK